MIVNEIYIIRLYVYISVLLSFSYIFWWLFNFFKLFGVYSRGNIGYSKIREPSESKVTSKPHTKASGGDDGKKSLWEKVKEVLSLITIGVFFGFIVYFLIAGWGGSDTGSNSPEDVSKIVEHIQNSLTECSIRGTAMQKIWENMLKDTAISPVLLEEWKNHYQILLDFYQKSIELAGKGELNLEEYSKLEHENNNIWETYYSKYYKMVNDYAQKAGLEKSPWRYTIPKKK